MAVSGRPLGLSEAFRAAGIETGHSSTLAQLRNGRWVRAAGPFEREEIETYHDRVREAVVARITPDALKGHHGRLATALELSGRADLEEVAVHYLGAEEAGRAGEYYARAAAVASEALAFDKAATLYRLARELGPADRGEQVRLRVATGDALANAGHGGLAAEEYLAAAESSPPEAAFELRRRAAFHYMVGGHFDEGLRELGAVLEAVGLTLPRTPGRAILLLLLTRLQIRLRGLQFRPRDAGRIAPESLARIETCYGAATSLGTIDPIRGSYFQARGLLFALRAGEPSLVFRALIFEAAHIGALGGSHQRRFSRIVEAAESLERRYRNRSTAGRIVLARGMAAYFSGRWREATECFDRGLEVVRDHSTGFTWEINVANLYALWSLQFEGRIGEVSRRWPAFLEEARDRGDRHMVALLNSFLLSTLRLASDDPDGAERGLMQSMDWGPRQGFLVLNNEEFGAEVQNHLYRGDGAAAWDLIANRYAPSLARSHLLRFQKVRIFFYERRARCALAAVTSGGDPRRLLKAAEADARRLRRERMPWADALSRMVLAGLAATRGDRAGAREGFADAMQSLEGVDMHLHAATARRRLGEAMGGDQGRALVAEADEWMSREGIRNPERMADIFAPAVL